MTDDKKILIAMSIAFAGWFVLTFTIGYVIAHFVVKFW